MKAAWLSITSPKRRKAVMSEDKTKEMNESRSFEERVFARFDAVDERFERIDERIEGRLVNVEIRISKLEERQYDTKPIWEQVLAAIVEINTRLDKMDARFDGIDVRLDKMDARFDGIDVRLDKMDARFDGIDARLDKMDTRFDGIDARLDKMDARFDGIDARLDKLDARFDKHDADLGNGFRSVERKMYVLNKYFLKTRADQRYLDDRLEKLESQSKPS
jgi:archaellum component FlaC